MDFLTRAYELQEETIANRRHIHQHAETGWICRKRWLLSKIN